MGCEAPPEPADRLLASAARSGLVRRAVLKVSGIGCGSCVVPSKGLFLRVEGVRSVRVLGSLVEISYDESKLSLEDLIERSGVEKYYFVSVVSDEPGETSS
ncbi:MAG: heavy-metal-associated domain-containing protein [Thermofilum sp.]